MPKIKVSLEIHALKNLTTDMSILKNNTNHEVIEIDEHHLSLEVPANSCIVGQLVKLDGVLFLDQSEHSFKATGKTREINPSGNNKLKLSIELHSHDKDLWKKFNNTICENQKNADLLFKKIKGEE